MAKLSIIKEFKAIRSFIMHLLEHIGVFIFILFLPLTALFVLGIAFVAGIFTKGLVR
jgi:hypothetical protein